MSNCIKIGSFGATDISATLGSGINVSRAKSCCTRLLLEFRSRKRFANHVCWGRFAEKLGGRNWKAIIASNTRNFFSIFLTLHRMIAYVTVKSKDDARAAAAASVLASLPAEYRNKLCSDFAAKYAPQPGAAAAAGGTSPAAPAP
jgi:hypothetical protein